MKIVMVDRTSRRRTTPDSIGRTMSTTNSREGVETWTTSDREYGHGGTDRLYLRDATLTVDHTRIIGSTIAGIEGSGGPISMMWIELGSEGVVQGG